jgi:hypothetical protein
MLTGKGDPFPKKRKKERKKKKKEEGEKRPF